MSRVPQMKRCALVAAAPQANIDFQCRQLKLGLRPPDLVRELTASFFCPLPLSRECFVPCGAPPIIAVGPPKQARPSKN